MFINRKIALATCLLFISSLLFSTLSYSQEVIPQEVHQQPFLPDPNTDVASLEDRKNISIAVIGGGTSGLLTAWNLRRLGYKVAVYEKTERLGGNVNTKQVSIDCVTTDCIDANGEIVPKKIYNRWADMGVNDFNTKTYHYIVWLLGQLATANPEGTPKLPDGTRAFYSKLIDNTTFLTYSGEGYKDAQPSKVCDNPEDGASCTQYEILGDAEAKAKYPAPQQLQEDVDLFFCSAPKVMEDGPCHNSTVDDYFFGTNGGEACYKKQTIPATCKGTAYHDVTALANFAVKPRINNMYFTNGRDPGSLVLRAVMNYYYLQEGLTPGKSPDPYRVFFVRGASSWIDALTGALTCEGDCDKYYFDDSYPNKHSEYLPGPPVEIFLGRPVHKVFYSDHGAVVSSSQGDREFQQIVFTVPAYVLAPDNTQLHDEGNYIDTSELGLPEDFYRQVKNTTYFADLSFAHTNPEYVVKTQGQLDALNTYNIFIPDYLNPPKTSLPYRAVPYTISYVANDHQNDADNYPGEPQPLYFVSVGPSQSTPTLSPPCNANSESDNPCVALSDGAGTEAKSFLHHLVLDKKLMTLQKTIIGDNTSSNPGLQGYNGKIFFAGGWVKGAGLQEQCFRQSVQVAYTLEYPNSFKNLETFFDGAEPNVNQGRPVNWDGDGAGIHPKMFSVSEKKVK